MQTRVKWLEQKTFVAQTGSGHVVAMDGSPDSGGRNLAGRPMEMVLVGLGGCSAYDVVMMLEKSRQLPDALLAETPANGGLHGRIQSPVVHPAPSTTPECLCRRFYSPTIDGFSAPQPFRVAAMACGATLEFLMKTFSAKPAVTGNKETDKLYHHHTGYIGGLKTVNLAKQRAEHPERILQSAVKGMLPKNPLGRAMFKKLRVFAGSNHSHVAQQPTPLDI